MKKRINMIYEVTINIVAGFIVLNTVVRFLGYELFRHTKIYRFIELMIYFIFTVEYVYRLIIAKDKKAFIKNNIFDLLAIIPFSSVFRIFRIIRAIKLIKKSKIKKIGIRIKQFINTNSFSYVLYGTLTLVFVGGYTLYRFEEGKSIHSLWDGIWTAFVTITTVGYGDYAPVTVWGRITAMILMLVGIGFLGMLTGTISTYFINKRKSQLWEENYGDEYKTVDLSEFTEVEIKEIKNFIEFMRSRKK
ncbi:potassium channel family protein [Oceanirhabdus seepicola]|uniref:Potassium channel family protein n=1 Tax=Oceanirhabdus seepicola TaxID=2828781 RepID=A0A9J6PDR5_9CLOT|nr:potassium channel family protein [Oceanirhabdus seepicola]MCM1992616.1 potassium channel family protein [Oceanirhabdus seepicola]